MTSGFSMSPERSLVTNSDLQHDFIKGQWVLGQKTWPKIKKTSLHTVVRPVCATSGMVVWGVFDPFKTVKMGKSV